MRHGTRLLKHKMSFLHVIDFVLGWCPQEKSFLQSLMNQYLNIEIERVLLKVLERGVSGGLCGGVDWRSGSVASVELIECWYAEERGLAGK